MEEKVRKEGSGFPAHSDKIAYVLWARNVAPLQVGLRPAHLAMKIVRMEVDPSVRGGGAVMTPPTKEWVWGATTNMPDRHRKENVGNWVTRWVARLLLLVDRLGAKPQGRHKSYSFSTGGKALAMNI